ncbi:MAG: putative phosphoribosyl transferase, partial [Actinomycetota bacterium]
MLAEVTLDVEVARGVHVTADVAVPEDARGVVACANRHPPLAKACNERGFATAQLNLVSPAHDVERGAAIFADAVTAITNDAALRDRPVGYFGAGMDGVAALVAASLHANEVACVVALDAPLHLAGAHLSGVRAATLFLVDTDDEASNTNEELPPLPGGSMLVQVVPQEAANIPIAAADWFDRYLRGVMRGARR